MKIFHILPIVSVLATVNGMAVHDFHFRKMDGTVCQSMRYSSPWISPVDVDQYIEKHPYIQQLKMKRLSFSEKDLESIREDVQSSLFSTKGMVLFTNGIHSAITSTELLSHFVCGYDMNNQASTYFVPVAFHVCRHADPDTKDPTLFIRNVVGKISNEIPEFGNIIHTDKNIQRVLRFKRCNQNPLNCLEKGLIEPLHRIKVPAFKRLLLLSRFDECGQQSVDVSLDRLLLDSLHKFPYWFKFLIISKGNYALRKQFQHKGFKYIAIKERSTSFWEELEKGKLLEFENYHVVFVIIALWGFIDSATRTTGPDNTHISTRRYRRIPTSLHRESFRGNIKKMQSLVDEANINKISGQVYLTPLHLAAVNNQFHACEWLLHNGADSKVKAHVKSYEHIIGIKPHDLNIDLSDFKDATPLRLAVLFKHTICVEVLSHWPVSQKEIKKCLKIAENNDDIKRILLNCTSFRRDSFSTDEDLCIKESDELLEVKNAFSNQSHILFKNHSNLNIINSGNFGSESLKSFSGYDTYITLYCNKKGQIPVNEHEFPKELKIKDKHIQIFVKDGFFQLCPGYHTTNREWTNPLRIGSCIGVQGTMYSATMGPFIELPDGTLGFLTCAHLFSNIPQGAVVIQPSHSAFAGWDISDSERVCGLLQGLVFDPNRTVSVDVAVVKITSRIPNRGLFAIGSNAELLNAGFDASEVPVFDTGSIKETIFPRDATRPIFKFGSETGLTKGLLSLHGSHVRISERVNFESPHGNQTLILKNQYEIQQVGNVPFFKPGDSGSGVFLLDDQRELHCIGLAIGCTSYGSAIVTPIGAVLEALGLPKRLKCFVQEPMVE